MDRTFAHLSRPARAAPRPVVALSVPGKAPPRSTDVADDRRAIEHEVDHDVDVETKSATAAAAASGGMTPPKPPPPDDGSDPIRHMPLFAGGRAVGLPPRQPVQRKCASPSACECDDCRATGVQTGVRTGVQKKDGGPPSPSRVSTEVVRRLAAHGIAGSPTSLPHLPRMQPLFGHHAISDIKAFVGARATEATRQMGALAYATGDSVAFAAWPTLHTAAHEAAHVIQQRAGVHLDGGVGTRGDAHEREADAVADRVVRGESVEDILGRYPPGQVPDPAPPAVQRETDPAAPAAVASTPAPADGPQFSVAVSMQGMTFQPSGGMMEVGSRVRQALQVVLRRLIGSQYTAGMEIGLESALTNLSTTGLLTGNADKPEPWPPFTVDARISLEIVAWAQAPSRGFNVALTADELDLLALGLGAEAAWAKIHDPQLSNDLLLLPGWFLVPSNEGVFINQMGSRTDLLRDFMLALNRFQQDTTDTDALATLTKSLNQILGSLDVPTGVLDAIREDKELVPHTGYQLIWPAPNPDPQPDPKKAAPKRTETAGPDERPAVVPESFFLTWISGQEDLAQKAMNEHAVRVQVLDRFVRFLEVALARPSGGDQKTHGAPGKVQAVLPAFDARLTESPGIEAPMFSAITGTDYTFDLQLMFPDVFEALGTYAYDWERVEIDPEKGEEGATSKPTMGETAAERFKRTGADNEEDLKKFGSSIISQIGQPGLNLRTVIQANNALRYVGTSLRLAFEVITKPASEQHVVFPHPGWYLVRVKAVGARADQADVVRDPSVAFTPVHVTKPAELATELTNLQASAREQKVQRMLALEKMLSGANTTLPNQPELQKEYDALYKELVLTTTVDQLNTQLNTLRSRVGTLSESSPEYQQTRDQIDRVERLLEIRTKRAASHALGAASRVTATFVGDDGRTLPLLLEAVRETPADATNERYYVSDLTTSKSDDATADGATAADAIANAVVTILQGIHGYGRGYVSISLTGGVRSIRIAASLGNLLSEAIGNITTAVSVVAIAAAPLTGGATLALLLPVGLVGAIPSAYRLATTAENGTFEWDLETLTDIINIVGGFAGAGASVARALQYVRIAEGLMVIGVGAGRAGVMMIGVSVLNQIATLDPNLPPGLRRARVLEIMAQAGLQAGMIFAHTLAEQAQAAKAGEAHATTPEKVAPRDPAAKAPPADEVPAEKSAGEPGAPAHAAPATSATAKPEFQSWERSLSPETQATLAADPELRRVFAEMDPAVRRVLTLCESLCIPTDPKPSAANVKAIEDLIGRLGLSPDHPALREFLHYRRKNLSAALDRLQNVETMQQLKVVLDAGIQEYAQQRGGTAQRGPDGRWVFTNDQGVSTTEWSLGIHSEQGNRGARSFMQSHHGIQDEWALSHLPPDSGYTSGSARTIMLRDSRTGTPHRIVTDRQAARAAGRPNRTYVEERSLLVEDMNAAGVDASVRDQLLADSDSYFADRANQWWKAMGEKGVSKEQRDINLRRVFGNWDKLP